MEDLGLSQQLIGKSGIVTTEMALSSSTPILHQDRELEYFGQKSHKYDLYKVLLQRNDFDFMPELSPPPAQ